MLNTGTTKAVRRIVVFFLVDPEQRIVSTQEVLLPPRPHEASVAIEHKRNTLPSIHTHAHIRTHRRVPRLQVPTPQQTIVSLDDARAHRLKLMHERKYHKQDWNVREIELCEH